MPLSLLLWGCGGLGTPALAPEPGFGGVSGRIVGAATGAYVYPLGEPERKVSLAADGSYAFDSLPAGAVQLVLWDGVDRAELVTVQVAAHQDVGVADRYGANAPVTEGLRMPLAGSVLAAVAPEGGAIAWLPAFSVRLTVLSNVQPASGGVTTIYPLPSGTFALGAVLPGFQEGSAPVAVLAGATSTAQVALPIDSQAAAPGCGSAPGCESGLVCNPTDGRCYLCTAYDSSHCASNEVCDTTTGLCKASGAGLAAICSSCGSDGECAPGVCIIGAGSTVGYCSHTCSVNNDCPAGFYCGSTSKRCKAPSGCASWLQTMGATCLGSDRCEDALNGGTCVHADDEPGYCSAPCQSSTDCRVGSGVASTMTCTGGYCRL